MKLDSAVNRGSTRRRVHLLLNLKDEAGDEAGTRTVSLAQGEVVTFGSSLGADYTFSGPELQAIHCRFIMAPSGCYIECLSSNAQFRHNGVTKSRSRLKHGDEIEFGDVRILALDPDRAPTPIPSTDSDHASSVDANCPSESPHDVAGIESGETELLSSGAMEVLPAPPNDLVPESLNLTSTANLSDVTFLGCPAIKATIAENTRPFEFAIREEIQKSETVNEVTPPASWNSVDSSRIENLAGPQILAVESSQHGSCEKAIESLAWEVWPDGFIRSTRCDSEGLRLLGLSDSANVYFLKNSELASCSWPEFVCSDKPLFGDVVLVSHEQRSELAPFLERKWRAKMSRQGAMLGALQLPVAKAKQEFFERCQLVVIIGQDGYFHIFTGSP